MCRPIVPASRSPSGPSVPANKTDDVSNRSRILTQCEYEMMQNQPVRGAEAPQLLLGMCHLVSPLGPHGFKGLAGIFARLCGGAALLVIVPWGARGFCFPFATADFICPPLLRTLSVILPRGAGTSFRSPPPTLECKKRKREENSIHQLIYMLTDNLYLCRIVAFSIF